LTSTQTILDPFEAPAVMSPENLWWACRIGETVEGNVGCIGGGLASSKSCRTTVVTVVPCRLRNQFGEEGPSSWFGMMCCTFLSNHLFLFIGGIQIKFSSEATCQEKRVDDVMPIHAYWVSRQSAFSEVSLEIKLIPLSFDSTSDKRQVDFGSVVNNLCIAVSRDEVMFVGGGVQSFAFGECYAE
jgi:hypothetical protein